MRQMTPDTRPELQRDVQRLLGRCLLRLQQYERLMKALLAHHELQGPVPELAALRTARIEKYGDKSLGTLVKSLFDSFLVEEGTDRLVLDESKLPKDKISLGFQVRVESTDARRAEMKAALEDLVAMRNDLVHHLIERFDVWADEGCIAASKHLMQCYDRIDLHFVELQGWTEKIDEAHALFASFSQSSVFKDFIVSGIAPDGTFDWPHTGIVKVLCEAVDVVGLDGWVRLDEATAWIAAHHPEQNPEKYRCRSWPHVLHESRNFELQYRESASGSKSAWYRLRQTRT
jgi:hypothetical protein